MRLTTITLVLAVCTLLIGCKSPTSPLTQEEEKLVGKYYVTMSKDMEQTDKTPAMSIMLEGYNKYASHRMCKMEGAILLVIKSLKELNQLAVTLEYHISAEGTWRIENGYIKGTTDPQSIEFKFAKSNAETKEAKMFVELIESTSPIETFKIKELFMRAEGDDIKIIELTDEKLVIEQEGEQITMAKIK